MESLVENIDLVRKIAWKFAKKTGLDYHDLFQEAAVRYCLAQEDWEEEKSKSCKFTTFAYRRMYFRLVNFCKEEENFHTRHQCHDEFPRHLEPTQNGGSQFEDKIESWPEECLQVIEMILDSPEKFLGETPNFERRRQATPLKAKGRVEMALEHKGWSSKRIRNTLQTLQGLVQTL